MTPQGTPSRAAPVPYSCLWKFSHPSAAGSKMQTLNLTRHQELLLLRRLTGSISSLLLSSLDFSTACTLLKLHSPFKDQQIPWVTPATRTKDTHSTAALPVSWHTPPCCTPSTLTTSQLNLFFPRSAYSVPHFHSEQEAHLNILLPFTTELYPWFAPPRRGCALLCQY